MKNKVANVFALIWFFGVLSLVILFTVFMMMGIIFGDIIPMLKNGVTSSIIGLSVYFVIALLFGITGWVPVFRRCYYIFPWLYPLSMFMMIHFFILSVVEFILAKGFSVINPTRYKITILIAILFVIISRIIVCIVYHKFPLTLKKYDKNV